MNFPARFPTGRNDFAAFDPLRIRIGGSLQDQVIYKVHWPPANRYCPKFNKTPDGMFGFSEGCLEMDRWDQINSFMNQTG